MTESSVTTNVVNICESAIRKNFFLERSSFLGELQKCRDAKRFVLFLSV